MMTPETCRQANKWLDRRIIVLRDMEAIRNLAEVDVESRSPMVPAVVLRRVAMTPALRDSLLALCESRIADIDRELVALGVAPPAADAEVPVLLEAAS